MGSRLTFNLVISIDNIYGAWGNGELKLWANIICISRCLGPDGLVHVWGRGLRSIGAALHWRKIGRKIIKRERNQGNLVTSEFFASEI